MKKIIALFLSLSLIVTLLPAGVFSTPVSAVNPIQNHTISDYAKITSSVFYDSDTTVINIQDLHNNKEVQNNIYKLLEAINKKYDNVEVYMEGASEDVNFSELSSAGIQNTSLMIEKLFKDDKISGTEFFGYKNNKILKPIEDKYVYDRNIRNYYQLILNQKEIKNLLLQEYIDIKNLDKYLTKEQKEIVNLYNKYLNNKVSREKFCKVLYRYMKKLNISDWRYPNSKLYHDITKANRKIDKQKVQAQLQSAMTDLKASLNYQDYVKLLKDSDNLSDTNFVFSFLSVNVSKENKLKYPELFKFIKTKELLSLINPLDLVREDREKVEDILFTQSTTVTNKETVFLNLFFQVYKKLLLASISAEEYEYYKQNYEYFSKVYSKYLNGNLIKLSYYRQIAQEFNELNIKRNQIFINKLDINNDGIKRVKVLVSGGFHTEGLNEFLDKNKISHITLTPNIKKDDVSYQQQYLNSIVKQAEADFNAISKEPWIKDKYPALHILALIKQGCKDFNRIKKEKSSQEAAESVNNHINGHIKNDYSLQDTVKFKLNEDGFAYVTIGREGFAETFVLDFRSTDVLFSDDTIVTTLAKNVKLMIRKILSDNNIRMAAGIPLKEQGGTKEKSYLLEEYRAFMEHNILFSDFANVIIKSLFKRVPYINKEQLENNRVYKVFNEIMNSIGRDFEGC
ncbi:MAG: hypothetical protein II816_03185, partial [Elusimicrobia bacterium]|nr:hypothetical protein [Elusimicrobiota bacterium]